MTDPAINLVPANLERGMEQVNLLAELGQEFAQSIDIEETLKRVVDRITSHMNAEAASVFLVTECAEGL